MAKIKGKAAKPRLRNARIQILHELNKAGQHRLVLVKEGEAPDYSAWFASAEVGHYKGFHFVVNSGLEHHLNAGVFRQTMVDCKILDARRWKDMAPMSQTIPFDAEKSDG